MDSPNFQFQTETEYKDGDKGTGAWAIKPGPAEIPEVPLVPGTPVNTEDFEGTLWTQLNLVSTSGWFVTATDSHGGTKSYESEDVVGDVTSSLVVNDFSFSPQLSFWIKADMVGSSDDKFEVLFDDVPVYTLEESTSGWVYVAIETNFAFNIEFKFFQDSPFTSTFVRIDDIIFGDLDTPAIPGVPARPFVYTPLKMTDDGECLKISICDLDTNGALPVTGRALDCELDSVTICPPVSGIFDVEIVNEVDIRNLDCTTDSITVCPPASGSPPFNVEIVNEVDIRNLDCAIDSITICPPASGGQPFEVTIIDQPIAITGRALDCSLDSITICPPVTGIEVTILDQPVSVTGLVTTVPGRRTLRGLYYGSSGAIAYTTAADSATGGDIWIVNTSSTVVAYIREIRFTSNIASLGLLTTLPRINLERMTFTGTPSGAQITPAKRDSLDPANTATVRTAATGMTITAGAVVKSFSPPSSDVIGGLLAANASSAVPVEQIFVGDIDSFIVLRQNEGIVFRQANAGSATENRVYNVDFIWEEI